MEQAMTRLMSLRDLRNAPRDVEFSK